MKGKDFDCVQMKWDIQQKMREEDELFGKEEARRRRWQRVLNNPILGPVARQFPLADGLPAGNGKPFTVTIKQS